MSKLKKKTGGVRLREGQRLLRTMRAGTRAMNQPSKDGSRSDPSSELVRHLTESQNRLYAYIMMLCPDPELARDVLQETNVVLWRKADQFRPGTNFAAWACKVAYYEVLAARKKLSKDRLLFDDSTIESVAGEAVGHLEGLSDREVALSECLERLDQRQRTRLMDRYGPGGSVERAASRAGQSRASISVALHRLRAALQQCIERKMGAEFAS